MSNQDNSYGVSAGPDYDHVPAAIPSSPDSEMNPFFASGSPVRTGSSRNYQARINRRLELALLLENTRNSRDAASDKEGQSG